MKVEKLDVSHLKECSLIYVETFNGEPWNDKWDTTTSYKRLEDIYNTPGFVGMVVYDEEKLLGAVLGNLEQWFEGYMYNLKEMFVKQDEKGKGIGSLLMMALEKSLSQLGTTSISLFTSKGDLTEKFYLKNGYSQEEDMIMMCKSL